MAPAVEPAMTDRRGLGCFFFSPCCAVDAMIKIECWNLPQLTICKWLLVSGNETVTFFLNVGDGMEMYFVTLQNGAVGFTRAPMSL
jgi:hypothetical protein